MNKETETTITYNWKEMQQERIKAKEEKEQREKEEFKITIEALKNRTKEQPQENIESGKEDKLQKYLDDYIYVQSTANYYSPKFKKNYTAAQVVQNIQALAKTRIANIDSFIYSGAIKSYDGFCFGEDKSGMYDTFDESKILKPSNDYDNVSDIITLFESITGNNIPDMEYLMKYTTWKYLHPLSPNAPAIILHGAQGTGKSSYARLFRTIFSKEYTSLGLTQRDVESNFDSVDGDTLVCELSEITTGNSKKDITLSNKLKNLVLAEEVGVRKLYNDRISVTNHNTFIITSNYPKPVKLDSEEIGNRRFSVFKSGTNRLSELSFNAISNPLKVAGFLGYLIESYGDEVKDMDSFPEWDNEAKRILASKSTSEYEQYWTILRDKISGEFISNEDIRIGFKTFISDNDYDKRLISGLLENCPWEDCRTRIEGTQPRGRWVK